MTCCQRFFIISSQSIFEKERLDKPQLSLITIHKLPTYKFIFCQRRAYYVLLQRKRTGNHLKSYPKGDSAPPLADFTAQDRQITSIADQIILTHFLKHRPPVIRKVLFYGPIINFRELPGTYSEKRTDTRTGRTYRLSNRSFSFPGFSVIRGSRFKIPSCRRTRRYFAKN